MSSTNRGGERIANDFYATPQWCVRAIIPHLPPLHSASILEPSAGRGAIVRALIDGKARPSRITAIEQDQARRNVVAEHVATILADFTAIADHLGPFDLVVMNPPYSDAQDHVTHALSFLAPHGLCAALLRLPFITGSGCRAFRAAHPCDVYPLASRPSFTAEALEWMTDADLLAEAKAVKAKGDKPAHVETIDEVRTRLRGSDSVDYAWFLFPATRVPGVRYSSDMVLDGKGGAK